LIDWCLMATLEVFQLYRGIEQIVLLTYTHTGEVTGLYYWPNIFTSSFFVLSTKLQDIILY